MGYNINVLDYVFKRSNNNTNGTIARANKICDGYIYLISSLKENKVNSVDEIWDLEGEPLNTYKVYLYSLQFIAYLNNAYSINNDVKYLNKVEEILRSWCDYLKVNLPKFMNYDFTVANRVIIITEFINICLRNNYNIDNILILEIVELLKKDIEILYDDNHYRLDNHGIMMDRAMLQYSIMFEEEKGSIEIKNKAINRIEKQFSIAFDKDYINVENSCEYHHLNYKLFKDINEFIDINKLEISLEKFNLEEVYKTHLLLLKNNKSYPLIGDSSLIYYKDDEPIYGAKVYEEAGIGIFKEPNYYLLCKSGLLSESHKHHDDNSFYFSYLDNDIFIDGGKYSYNNKDPYRNYLRSPAAHNTFTINDEFYELNKNGVGISSYTINNYVNIISLYNNNYNNVEFLRKIIHIKPNYLFFVNELKSEKTNNYKQVFNIDSKFRVLNKEENNIVLDNDIIKVKLEEHNNNCDLKHFFGENKNGYIKGFKSEKFNSIEPCNYVEFEYKEKTLKSITSVLVNSDREHDEIKDVSFQLGFDNTIDFTLIYRDTKKVLRVDIDKDEVKEYIYPKVDIKNENGKIEFIIDEICEKNKYAIYEIVNDKIIKKISYSNNKVYTFNNIQNETHEIWLFIKYIDNAKVIYKYKV